MQPVHLVGCIHPASLLYEARPIADTIRYDLQKANRISLQGPQQIENLLVVHPSSPVGVQEATKRALQWLERWRQLKCPVAVDVETSALSIFRCKLYSIALSGEDGENVAVAFTLHDLHTLPWDAEAALIDGVKRLLVDPEVPTVYHNAPFDFAVLTHKNYIIKGPIEDTQGYIHLVQPDLPQKDLGWVGHTYLDVEPWKLNHEGQKQVHTQDVIELLIYNAKDALNTMKLRSRLVEEIYDKGMNSTLISYQNAFAQLAADMELVGLPVNHAKRKAMGAERLEEIERLKKEMRDYLNWPDFNPMSPSHKIEALYGAPGAGGRNCCGLTPEAYTEKTQQSSTKYEHLLDHLEHPFVSKFIKFVEERHAYSTQYKDPDGKSLGGAYCQAIEADGRLHAKFNATGTKGSRYSSSPNVQNQRGKDKPFFEEAPGRVFVGADLDQLELRLAATFAGARELLTEINRPGGDPHRWSAINIFGDSFLKKPADTQKKLRDGVKTTVYASLYRAGVKTVHKAIRKKKFLSTEMRAAMTLPVVNQIYHGFFGKNVEITAWHDENLAKAENEGFLEIPPFKRRRYFQVKPVPFGEVASWPVQTPGSDIATMHMVHISEELKRKYKDAHVVLHLHDAVYVTCRENDAEAIKKLVNDIFGSYILEGPAGSCQLTCSAKIGRSLYDVK